MITIQSGLYKWFAYITMGIMCTIGAIFIIVAAFEFVPFSPPENRSLFLAFSLIWTVTASWIAYTFLRMPTEINVTHTGTITLQSPVRTITLEPYEIIKFTCDTDGDWMLHYMKGRLDLRYFRYNELKPFLSWAVRANPRVQAPSDLPRVN